MNKYKRLDLAIIEVGKMFGTSSIFVNHNNDEFDYFDLLEFEYDLLTDNRAYYVIGYDGSIGYTDNNGYDVIWIYTLK